MRTTTDAVQECVGAVDAIFAAVSTRVNEWRSHIERLAELADGVVTTEAVDTLVESMVVPVLERTGALEIGGGFVAAPGFLADTDWHLAWWLGGAVAGRPAAAPRVRRLLATEDPGDDSFRDYTTLEWWRIPASTRAPHLTGPYVDYLCTDDYTLTLTAPAVFGETMVGVVGADLYVADVERSILPALRSVSETMTLVNAWGRVVVSTDPHLATGSILRAGGERLAFAGSGTLPDGRRVLPCGSTNLTFIVG
jgi:hypothetical protein